MNRKFIEGSERFAKPMDNIEPVLMLTPEVETVELSTPKVYAILSTWVRDNLGRTTITGKTDEDGTVVLTLERDGSDDPDAEMTGVWRHAFQVMNEYRKAVLDLRNRNVGSRARTEISAVMREDISLAGLKDKPIWQMRAAEAARCVEIYEKAIASLNRALPRKPPTRFDPGLIDEVMHERAAKSASDVKTIDTVAREVARLGYLTRSTRRALISALKDLDESFDV